LPQNALKGARTGDSWSLSGPQGWFEATWDSPVRGRYVLLIGRTSTSGADPWGKSLVSINGHWTIELKEMSGSHVVVIDLGRPVGVKTLHIDIDGRTYPGLAGLEIHP
jgi:hypothetical protein